MENQVLSPEQMQKLIGMGVDVSKASMYWYIKANPITKGWDKPELCMEKPLWPNPPNKVIPTFTLQDILKIIKEKVLKRDLSLDLEVDILNDCLHLTKEIDHRIHTSEGNSLLKAAFNMLKWCKENNFI